MFKIVFVLCIIVSLVFISTGSTLAKQSDMEEDARAGLYFALRSAMNEEGRVAGKYGGGCLSSAQCASYAGTSDCRCTWFTCGGV